MCSHGRARRTSIGRPLAEGIVRLRLLSPTVKQSIGLFAFISGARPKLMLFPLLRLLALWIPLPAGSGKGLYPLTLQGFLAP